MGLSNSDIVNRYACADVYSFSLIAWLILSQCPALWDERPNERRYLEDNIDDYMFEEFMRQAFNRDEYQRRFDTGNIIQKEKVMNDLLNIEKLRPYCPRTSSDALNNLFCLVRECWAEHGVFRPDSRQIYSEIKDIQRELNQNHCYFFLKSLFLQVQSMTHTICGIQYESYFMHIITRSINLI